MVSCLTKWRPRLPKDMSTGKEKKKKDIACRPLSALLCSETNCSSTSTVSFHAIFIRITDQHYLMKDIMGGNFHAPIDLAFKRVLENGCGAGDWTVVSVFLLFLYVLHRKQKKGRSLSFSISFSFGFLVVGERYMPAALISNLKRCFSLHLFGAGRIFRCFLLYLSIVHLN